MTDAPERDITPAAAAPVPVVAVVGRPNVGKSTLVNRILGSRQAVVEDTPGVTRDRVAYDAIWNGRAFTLVDTGGWEPSIEGGESLAARVAAQARVAVDAADAVLFVVDATVGGTTWRFVDTAGIRRRFKENQGADYYAALRTAGALDRAEVAVVLIDASDPLTEQDLRIVSMVIEAGRALVIAYNKWDMVDEERQHYLEREIDRQLHTARWAPRVNISAATGRHMDRLVPALETALEGWETRVPTGRLNAWLAGLVAATPPPVRGGRQPKILFATQAGVRPPHFVLFTSGFLEASYRRFVERRLREEFGFEGSPVQVSVRVRAKRENRPGRRPAARTARRRQTPTT